MAEGLEVAKGAIAEIIELQSEVRRRGGRHAAEFDRPALYAGDMAAVEDFAGPRLAGALVPGKQERDANLDALKDELEGAPAGDVGRGDVRRAARARSRPAFKDLQKKAMRRKVIERGHPAGRPQRRRDPASCPPRSA